MTAYSDGGSRWPTLREVIGALFIVAVWAQECSYDGGWSLRSTDYSSCPPDAPQECGRAGDLQMRCCPDKFSCEGGSTYEGNYCCQGSAADCISSASNTPKCPDSSWSLWSSNKTIKEAGGWCCGPDQKGVYRDTGTKNYFCTPSAEATLPADFYSATSVSTAPCSATAAATTPSDTADGGSSGISGGAIAGAVVGGVAGLALIGAGIFFLVRRMRKPRINVAQTVTTDEGTVTFQAPGTWNEGRRVS